MSFSPGVSLPPSRDEGYVKYHCDHVFGPAPVHPQMEELDRLRTDLYDAELVGMRPDGVGFGNVSVRAEGDHFVITATGTGGVRELGADGYCTVTGVWVEKNSLACLGPLPASSEALTHAAVYAASSTVRCVVHVHSRVLFDSLLSCGAVSTPGEAAYGTPDMAYAVEALVHRRPADGVLVMAGHDEGILIYGPSVAAVASLLGFVVRTYGNIDGGRRETLARYFQ